MLAVGCQPSEGWRLCLSPKWPWRGLASADSLTLIGVGLCGLCGHQGHSLLGKKQLGRSLALIKAAF